MEWISVEDRLPDSPNVRCFVARMGLYFKWSGPYDAAIWDGECFVSDCWDRRKFIGESSPDGLINNITHWMPLTEPPKVSK